MIALIASGILLFDTNSDVSSVSVPVAAAAGRDDRRPYLFAVSKAVAVAARPRVVRPGREERIGAQGTVRAPLDPLDQVFVEGAPWKARGLDSGARRQPGG